jgi:hypothetical protein
MSLLTACNIVAAEIGLPQFATIIGNSDIQAVQFLNLAQRSGSEIAEDPNACLYWQQLRKQYTFTTSGVGPYTCTITPNTTTITALSSTTGIALGQQVYAVGLVNDTSVTDVSQLGSGIVGISQAPTASVTLTGQSVVFATENYALPTDFRYMIQQTMWDRNFRWQLLGPLDAQEWQVIKSGISPVGPRMRFRIMGNQFYVNPVGSASTVFIHTLVYEYVSSWWVAVTAAPTVPAQTSFLLDTDNAIIDEDLLVLSLKWRVLRAKGLDYSEEKEQFETRLLLIKGRAATSRNLPLNARASGIRLLNSQNVPDTGFGS